MNQFFNTHQENIYNNPIAKSPVNLPVYDEEGNMVNILNIFDFEDMYQEYLIELEIRNYSQNTLKTYSSIIRNFNQYLKTQDKLYTDNHFIRSFKSYIQHLKREHKVTQNYIYLVTVSVKKFLEFNKLYFLDEIETPKRTKSLPKSLNEREVKNLIDAVNEDEDNTPLRKFTKARNKTILTILYSSGLRISELLNLHISDIDFNGRTMRIRGKGEKDRIVLFDETANEIILNYIEIRNLDETRKNNDLLILNKNSTHLSSRYVELMIKEYAKKAGINKKVTPHILRHSFATHLLKHGIDIRVIQQLLGHTNLSTTQIYTSVDMETIKTLYDNARN